MRNFRTLNADEIECRVQRTTAKGVQLLLYKTARTDYALLDETFGFENWQNRYKEVDGKVYCGIGIRFGNEWVWKENCGSESNMEAVKGEASDAMKRAGFAWGIGTELYSSPFIWIPADRCTITDNRCFDRFVVTMIEYDDQERISALAIDNASKRCNAFMFGRMKASDPASDIPKIDRKINISACVEMAKGTRYEPECNAEGYRGTPWEAYTDEQIVKLKLFFIDKKKNAEKGSPQ